MANDFSSTSTKLPPVQPTGIVKPVDFTATQRKVLLDMAAWHGQSIMMIAHRTGLRPMAVSNALAALERRGVVMRFAKTGANRWDSSRWAIVLPNGQNLPANENGPTKPIEPINRVRLSPAQNRQMDSLRDGQWHTYNGRRLAMIERLNALGLVEYEYLPGGVFGMPNWFRARMLAIPGVFASR